jgi:hypothetical protein
LLPQYRQLDRAKKKEKYEESLNLIQELIDCDDFEDISTLRVSSSSEFVVGVCGVDAYMVVQNSIAESEPD